MSEGPGGRNGSSIAGSLDEADRQALGRATQTALETAPPDEALRWKDQQTGHYGTVVPGSYYQTAAGQYCREFEQTINIGDEAHETHGRACRQPDGTWKIVE